MIKMTAIFKIYISEINKFLFVKSDIFKFKISERINSLSVHVHMKPVYCTVQLFMKPVYSTDVHTDYTWVEPKQL